MNNDNNHTVEYPEVSISTVASRYNPFLDKIDAIKSNNTHRYDSELITALRAKTWKLLYQNSTLLFSDIEESILTEYGIDESSLIQLRFFSEFNGDPELGLIRLMECYSTQSMAFETRLEKLNPFNEIDAAIMMYYDISLSDLFCISDDELWDLGFSRGAMDGIEDCLMEAIYGEGILEDFRDCIGLLQRFLILNYI